jgi:hypothetical protein
VLINAMIPKPGETPGKWWGNTGHGEAKRQQNVRDGRRADASFDPRIDCFHDVPQPWLTPPGRRANRVSHIPCLDPPALSRSGRTCQPVFWWGAMIGSFQPSSKGGWRVSVLESQLTRCPADIWSRSVNRRNYRHDSLLTLRRNAPANGSMQRTAPCAAADRLRRPLNGSDIRSSGLAKEGVLWTRISKG